MADPVLPGVFRAQCVLQGASNLPEDRYVTTWAFSGGTADDVASILGAMWIGGAVGQPTTGIGQWISGGVPRDNLEVRVYDLADPPGAREPLIETFTLPAAASPTILPSEVAIVATLGNSAQRRRRGRFYLGPLNLATSDATSGVARVANSAVQNIRDNCAWLSTQTIVPSNWGCISQVDGVFFAVDQGHVDNAFDTQRRRGEDATNRIPWPGVE